MFQNERNTCFVWNLIELQDKWCSERKRLCGFYGHQQFTSLCLSLSNQSISPKVSKVCSEFSVSSLQLYCVVLDWHSRMKFQLTAFKSMHLSVRINLQSKYCKVVRAITGHHSAGILLKVLKFSWSGCVCVVFNAWTVKGFIRNVSYCLFPPKNELCVGAFTSAVAPTVRTSSAIQIGDAHKHIKQWQSIQCFQWNVELIRDCFQEGKLTVHVGRAVCLHPEETSCFCAFIYCNKSWYDICLTRWGIFIVTLSVQC